MTRWYTAAYITHRGEVVQVGSETRDINAATHEARLIGQDADTEIFVAFKDEPDWRRLPAAGLARTEEQ